MALLVLEALSMSRVKPSFSPELSSHTSLCPFP